MVLLIIIGVLCSIQYCASQGNKIVSVYLLIDNISTLQQYMADLNAVEKVNFNRVIFSFVKPTLTNYTPGSLANTGILNYFNEGDGDGQKSFNLLRSAVALSKSKYVQAFLSVGGWNYSCNFAVYGELCGDAPTAENGIHYDFFPDPLDAQEKATASVAYSNIIKLSNVLGSMALIWTLKSSGTLISTRFNGTTTRGPALLPETSSPMEDQRTTASSSTELEQRPQVGQLSWQRLWIKWLPSWLPWRAAVDANGKVLYQV